MLPSAHKGSLPALLLSEQSQSQQCVGLVSSIGKECRHCKLNLNDVLATYLRCLGLYEVREKRFSIFLSTKSELGCLSFKCYQSFDPLSFLKFSSVKPTVI